MKKTLIYLLFLPLLFGMACKNNDDSKLVGTWKFGNDPGAYVFKADHTYEEQFLGEPLEILNKGTWSLEGDQLTLRSEKGEVLTQPIIFKDNMIYIGNFEEGYKGALGTISDKMTKEAYFKQFGYTKK
jgi:hypothetical protein